MSKTTCSKDNNNRPLSNQVRLSKTFLPAVQSHRISLFYNILNNIAEGVFIVNDEGVIEMINPLGVTFFGAPAESLLGQKWFYFLTSQYYEQYQDIFANWKNNQNQPLSHGPKEVVINRIDGTLVEADLSLSFLPTSMTGITPLFIGVLHNLSQHKAQYRELRKQAYTDQLTGLPNRYDLEQKLGECWNQCINNHQPLSLILIDVDYFKTFNDQYGHLNGDKCLQKIARVLQDCLPSNDSLAARYGGEEFVLILPHCPVQGAELVARHIQKAICALKFTDMQLDAHLSISVSQGIACNQGGQYRTPEALIFAADTALYRAKADGRNRINLGL
ncbi:sensor domain-containing diguanylate cyclase [Gynuella sunshinyii]|uniref:sensor domain-containing diguanylate cyclase n=1 Tax=Gynuella sunshinyii TaxID=1445505 RepID=UPI000A3E847B|nr:diguanylate cyclase [Gynuella sunshinyii]